MRATTGIEMFYVAQTIFFRIYEPQAASCYVCLRANLLDFFAGRRYKPKEESARYIINESISDTPEI